MHAIGVQADMAAVTGESVPQERDAEPDPHAEPTLARNILLAGVGIVSGEAVGVVFATGMRTVLGVTCSRTNFGRRFLGRCKCW